MRVESNTIDGLQALDPKERVAIVEHTIDSIRSTKRPVRWSAIKSMELRIEDRGYRPADRCIGARVLGLTAEEIAIIEEAA